MCNNFQDSNFVIPRKLKFSQELLYPRTIRESSSATHAHINNAIKSVLKQSDEIRGRRKIQITLFTLNLSDRSETQPTC